LLHLGMKPSRRSSIRSHVANRNRRRGGAALSTLFALGALFNQSLAGRGHSDSQRSSFSTDAAGRGFGPLERASRGQTMERRQFRMSLRCKTFVVFLSLFAAHSASSDELKANG